MTDTDNTNLIVLLVVPTELPARQSLKETPWLISLRRRVALLPRWAGEIKEIARLL